MKRTARFFERGTAPGFDNGNELIKSQGCPACGSTMMKALTVCPTCGVDRNEGIRKSATLREGGRLHDVPQTHSKGPGLRRARVEPDLRAPNGLMLD